MYVGCESIWRGLCLSLGDGDSSSSTPRMIAAIGYLDAFTKIDSRWYFAERKLLVDWIETRPGESVQDRQTGLRDLMHALRSE